MVMRLLLLLTFFVLLFSSADLRAQVVVEVDSSLVRKDSIAPDSALYIIESISYTGNKQTKIFILEREMTFEAGDTLSGVEFLKHAQRSRQNLLNTALFNFVAVLPHCNRDTSSGLCTKVDVVVNVKERWYTWPAPIFDVAEQNFNTWWRNGHNLQRASYGFMLWRYNFRGRKESIALICRFGYAEQFGAQYSIPYLNKKRTIGITFTGTYTRNHEVAYATRYNKLQFYKDREGYIRKETAGSIMLSYRQGLYVRHTFDMKYTRLGISDTVVNLASDYFAGGGTDMEYITLSYRVTRDYRDIKAYPLRGHFQEFEVSKHGLGILAGEKLDVLYITAGFRQYGEVLKRTFAAFMCRMRWMPGPMPPYYHQRALGFSNFIRGYEYYVIDGQSYAIAKTSLRYQLLKPHVYKFPFLPLEKFNTLHLAIYGGLYADAGYVEDRASIPADHNVLGNTLLFGYGAGLDFVTYYDIAMRVEYSFNRMGENGVFLHLGAAF